MKKLIKSKIVFNIGMLMIVVGFVCVIGEKTGLMNFNTIESFDIYRTIGGFGFLISLVSRFGF